MCVVPGAPLQLTFEPGFMQSDAMFYNSRGDQTYRDSILLATKQFATVTADGLSVLKMPEFVPQALPPEPDHILKFRERRAVVHVGAEIAAADDEMAAVEDGVMEEAPAPKKARVRPPAPFRLL